MLVKENSRSLHCATLRSGRQFFGIKGETPSAILQQNCHPDRSEAQWRGLLFSLTYAKLVHVIRVDFQAFHGGYVVALLLDEAVLHYSGLCCFFENRTVVDRALP